MRPTGISHVLLYSSDCRETRCVTAWIGMG